MHVCISVAAWSTAAVMELVNICADNREEFDRPVRHSQFWTQVSRTLGLKRWYYTAHQCEEKMKKLIQIYKDFEQDNKTGRPNPRLNGYSEVEVKLMGALKDLMAGNVTVNPKVTCGAGFDSRYEVQVSNLLCHLQFGNNPLLIC